MLKYPILKDIHGNGFVSLSFIIHHNLTFTQGSWKIQLHQKFKNMRRDPGRKRKLDEDKENEEPSASPQAKRQKQQKGSAIACCPSSPSNSGR